MITLMVIIFINVPSHNTPGVVWQLEVEPNYHLHYFVLVKVFPLMQYGWECKKSHIS